jgi:hypothetical protein
MQLHFLFEVIALVVDHHWSLTSEQSVKAEIFWDKCSKISFRRPTEMVEWFPMA